MNYLRYRDDIVNCGIKTLEEIHDLKEECKRTGIYPTDPITGLTARFVKPAFQDGRQIRRGHGRLESGTPIVHLQDRYLFDPDIMVVSIDDKAQTASASKSYDPPQYYSRAQSSRTHGQSLTHYEGNIHIRESTEAVNYRTILERTGHAFLLNQDLIVQGEYRLPIPSQHDRYRIIDNAVLDSNGSVLVAIEYQCSPLSRDALTQRIEDYLAADLHQVWILGGKCTDCHEMLDVLNEQGINQFTWGFRAEII